MCVKLDNYQEWYMIWYMIRYIWYIWCDIWYDMIRYMIRYDMIYMIWYMIWYIWHDIYDIYDIIWYDMIYDMMIWYMIWYVSNPRVQLQEDGCIYSYGMLCFTRISISSLVGRRVCSNTLFYLLDCYTEKCRKHQNSKLIY